MSTVPPHEYWYELALRAERRDPHAPLKMLSLLSQGPLWKYACPFPHCGNEVTTLPKAEWPKCSGGLRWSFQTAGTEK